MVACWTAGGGLADCEEGVVIVICLIRWLRVYRGICWIYGPRVLVEFWKLVDDYGKRGDMIQPDGLVGYMVACWWLINCRLPVVGAEDCRNAAKKKKLIHIQPKMYFCFKTQCEFSIGLCSLWAQMSWLIEMVKSGHLLCQMGYSSDCMKKMDPMLYYICVSVLSVSNKRPMTLLRILARYCFVEKLWENFIHNSFKIPEA